MIQYEIWWDDLTDTAKERLKDLYHANIELSPLATIDIEPDDDYSPERDNYNNFNTD